MDDQGTNRPSGAEVGERQREIDTYKKIVKGLRAGGWFGIASSLMLFYLASGQRPLNYLFAAAILGVAAYMHYRAWVATGQIRRAELELENS
jgi:hypothetical protein